jgi:alanyl-tRNA synthetase
MTGADIRATFLDFFRARGHEVVRSSSLIPANDPSLLFTNAGMVQFKSVFLGDERPPFNRAASSQKCLRAGGKHNDLENVGHTARHHTFFEMLGNFSFGDYFKRDAIQFAWDLLTGVFGLPREQLWVSVYEEDNEAAGIWAELTDVGKDRIVRLGARDNFWQMGDTGPCGPCSEIIIDQGIEVGCGKDDCGVGCDCDRYLEIWNLVFMQYDRDKTGTLSPLPRPSIDTGMGLERIAAVLQGKHNNFDSDIFSPIIADICSFSGRKYGSDAATDTAIRVIADHIRAVTFLLSEGLVPSNEGRGYVLRRIIRRASRYAKFLDIEEPVLYKLCESVEGAMGAAYPELIEEQSRVRKMLRLEEERFNRTLEQGLSLLNSIIRNIREAGKNAIPGEELFKLYDTFGFPIDIARDVAAENGLAIDEAGFHKEMETQKTKARASWSVEEAGVAPVYRDVLERYGKTEFTGYEGTESESNVVAVVVNGEVVEAIDTGGEGEAILDRTPFYAESGGQVGDTGQLVSGGMKASVLDTKKPAEGLHVHRVRIEEGSLKSGARVLSTVDRQRRAATMRNHTATHLLHAALRNKLGEHVKQAGSYVSPDRLRFDFTHFSPLGSEVSDELEDQVNDNIMKNLKVRTTVMETRKAIDAGVIALFGEKYGDRVRVLTISDVSSELCGGTHVSATGDIGLFKILSEGSVASGIRRIEAVTGWEAIRHYREEEKELLRVSELLKTSERPAEKLQKILSEMKDMERSIEKLKGRSAADVSAAILEKVRDVEGVRCVAWRLDGLDNRDLRGTADNVRDGMGSGILVLASVRDDQASIVAMVTKDLTDRYNAGNILREVATAAGGRGGGKADIAQGGTKEIKKLDKALESLYDIVGQG